MARALTPDDLVFGLETAADPKVSPDGRRIAHVVARADKESDKGTSRIWLRDTDGGNARPVTAGPRDREPRWSPDGQTVAFLSDRPGDGQQGVFLLPLAGGEARELTRHRGAISDLAWAPDGRFLAYSAPFDPANPDEEPRPKDAPPAIRITRRLDYKQDNRGYLDDVRLQVWTLDVETGDRRMVTRAAVDHLTPVWSPDGRTLAVKLPSKNGMRSQLGLVDVATGETKAVGAVGGVVACWSWSPGGERILIAGDDDQTWQTDWWVYDVAADRLDRLTDDLPCLPDAGFATVSPPSQPVWLDDRTALFHAVRAGSSGLYRLEVASGGVALVHDWRALHGGLSVDDAATVAVQGHASLEAAGEIAVYDLRANAGAIVSRHNAALLSEATPAAWERVAVERGGYEIEAWLLRPPGFDPAKRYPVVLDVHGGPNGHYGYGFNAVQQALAGAGYLVVFSNPRGSSSYGRRFTQQVIGDWGGEDYLDLMAVLDRVTGLPEADPSRVGIWGYSYGGFMTAWALGQSDRFRAAVCGAPCFDLESFFGTSDIGHEFGRIQFGAAPHEDPAWYAAHSPSNFAHRITTPTLIVHGEADDRCPIGQGEQLFVALHTNGVPVEFARYPGGSHLFMRGGPPSHRLDVLERSVAWFKTYLGEARPDA